MPSSFKSRLMRWAFSSHLLATVMAFSHWLLSSLVVTPTDAAGDWRLWRALLKHDAQHQRGLEPVRRVADAWRSLCRYRRVIHWRIVDLERQPIQLHA